VQIACAWKFQAFPAKTPSAPWGSGRSRRAHPVSLLDCRLAPRNCNIMPSTRNSRCIRCRRSAPTCGLCQACKRIEDDKIVRAAQLEAYRSSLPPSLPRAAMPASSEDPLISSLRKCAQSTASLDGYITAAISAGLLGDPGYSQITLDDVCLAAPQYLIADIHARTDVLERAARDAREHRARSAQELIGDSPFTAPKRWVPTDD